MGEGSAQKHQTNKQQWWPILANGGWLVSERVLRAMLVMLVGAWVARYLGPIRYGELAYVIAWLALFQAMVNLGLDAIVVRELAQQSHPPRQILLSTFVMRLLAGLLAMLLAVLGMALLHGWNSDSVWLTLMVAGALLFQAADVADLWFQSQGQNRYSVRVKIIAYTLSCAIKICFILVGAPLWSFALVVSMDAFFVASGLFMVARSHWCRQSHHGESSYSNILCESWYVFRTHAPVLLRESWPLMAAAVATALAMRVDQLLLKDMLGSRFAGLYAAILPFTIFWHILPLALVTSLAPWLARRKQESESGYRKDLQNIFRVILLLGLLSTFVMLLLAPLIVGLLLGEEYASAVPVLQLHVLANVFIFMGLAQSLWVTNERRSGVTLKQALLAAAVAISGNMFMIPWLGMLGAALTFVIAQATAAWVSNLYFAPPVFWMQLGLKPPGKLNDSWDKLS